MKIDYKSLITAVIATVAGSLLADQVREVIRKRKAQAAA